MTVQVIAVVTTLAWLFLLFVCVMVLVMDSGASTKLDFAIFMALVIGVCCVVVAAGYSIFRWSRILPVFLLVASLFPAFVFAQGAWRLQDPAGNRYFQIVFSGNYDCFHVLQDTVYIGLPFRWAVVAWRALLPRRTNVT